MEVESGEWRYLMLHYLTNYLCGGQQRKTRLFSPPSDTSAAFLSYKYGEIVW